MLVINFLPTVGSSICNFMALYEYYFSGGWNETVGLYRKYETKFWVTSILLNIVSASVLGVGVGKLYRIAKSGNMPDDRINVPQMILHLSAFLTYLLSVMVAALFYALVVWNPSPQKYFNWVVARICCNWMNMFSQVLLAVVLKPLTKEETMEETLETFGVMDTEDDDTEAAEWDEDAQVNLRIWRQLVKKGRNNEVDNEAQANPLLGAVNIQADEEELA